MSIFWLPEKLSISKYVYRHVSVQIFVHIYKFSKHSENINEAHYQHQENHKLIDE